MCDRFGEDSVEVADSSFVVASGYLDDDDSQHKAKQYLEDAISLNMKHRGPYHNATIKAQVCLPEVVMLLANLHSLHAGFPVGVREKTKCMVTLYNRYFFNDLLATKNQEVNQWWSNMYNSSSTSLLIQKIVLLS